MLAILPKFYSLGNDAEAGPMRWAGNLLPLEPRLHLFEACLERMAVVERAGLIRRPGAKLRIPTAGCEIGVPFLLTDFFHRTFNAYLPPQRSEEHTSELQSLMRISYAVFCLKKQKNN